jgi:hypothetical protein
VTAGMTSRRTSRARPPRGPRRAGLTRGAPRERRRTAAPLRDRRHRLGPSHHRRPTLLGRDQAVGPGPSRGGGGSPRRRPGLGRGAPHAPRRREPRPANRAASAHLGQPRWPRSHLARRAGRRDARDKRGPAGSGAAWLACPPGRGHPTQAGRTRASAPGWRCRSCPGPADGARGTTRPAWPDQRRAAPSLRTVARQEVGGAWVLQKLRLNSWPRPPPLTADASPAEAHGWSGDGEACAR